MTKETIEKHKCPSCNRDTNCVVIGRVGSTEHHDSHGDFSTYHTHFLLKCRGCDRIFHEWSKVFSEDVYFQGEDEHGNAIYFEDSIETYWPNASRRTLPKWIGEIKSEEISDALREVYRSLETNVPRLTAVGIRMIIDLVFEDLGIAPQKNFKQKLDEFRTLPDVRTEFADELEHMIDVGGAAIHRGWDPSSNEIDIMLEGLEAFLKNQYAPRKSVKTVKAPVKTSKKSVKANKP